MLGVALLGLHLSVFLSRGFAERSALWWFIGLAVAMIGMGELGQGLIEGGFHDAYVGKSLPSFVGQMAFLYLGTGWHLARTRFWLSYLK